MDSPYGYVPNLPANAVGAVLFFLILVNQLVFGIYAQDWWMFVTWGITAGLELCTYIGRCISNEYTGSLPMYEMQLCCSIFAPAFEAAGLYYLLGKQVTVYGEKYSLLPPMIYTAIFTTADVISLFIQGAGGGVAAAATSDPSGSSTRDGGRWTMVAGIAFQVAILSIFIILWAIVHWRIYRDDPANHDQTFAANRARPTFKYLFWAICVSLLFLEIRSIYRIVELADGWNGYIMVHERYFLVLDGLMIVISMVPLCIIYPGIAYGYVPVRGLNYKSKYNPVEESEYQELESQEKE